MLWTTINFTNTLRSIIWALCGWDSCLSLRNAPGQFGQHIKFFFEFFSSPGRGFSTAVIGRDGIDEWIVHEMKILLQIPAHSYYSPISHGPCVQVKGMNGMTLITWQLCSRLTLRYNVCIRCLIWPLFLIQHNGPTLFECSIGATR